MPTLKTVFVDSIHVFIDSLLGINRLSDAEIEALNYKPIKKRKTYMGITSVRALKPGETVIVKSMTQAVFRPYEVIIPDYKSFQIGYMQIGRIYQGISAQPIPAREYLSYDFDTMQVAEEFSMQVTNITNEPLEFRAVINGFFIV